MANPTPDELDKRLERMRRAVYVYRVAYEMGEKKISKNLKRLIDATDPWDPIKRKKFKGLIAGRQMLEDLLRLYGEYSQPNRSGYRKSLLTIAKGRVIVARLDNFLLNEKKIAEGGEGRDSGPFGAALSATGLIWGLSNKGIQKQLRSVGLPYTLSEFKRVLIGER